MSQVDPLEKAAECELALQNATDANRRALLTHLRDLWTAHARSSFWSETDRQQQLAILTQIHADMTRSEMTLA